MGMSSKKTKSTQTNKPVYSAEVEGAAKNVNSAYNAQAPKIAGFSDDLLGISSDLMQRYRDGVPTIDAAENYITSTLAGDPKENPFLDSMVAKTTENTRRQTLAGLGTRGLTGGSVAADQVSKNMGDAELGMRYQDYDREMARRAQAAGMAPAIAAGDYMTLLPALQTGEAGAMMPLDAASRAAAATGGLLGQYQDVNSTQKTSGGFLGDLILAGVGSAGSYFGGGG